MIIDIFTNECDYITSNCFVTISTETRLFSFQKYILSDFMELFGNKIGENFIVILIFCNGDKSIIINYLENENTDVLLKQLQAIILCLHP